MMVRVFFMVGKGWMLVAAGVFCNCWLRGAVEVRKLGYLNPQAKNICGAELRDFACYGLLKPFSKKRAICSFYI